MKKIIILILYSLLMLIIGLASGECFASSNKLKNYLSNKIRFLRLFFVFPPFFKGGKYKGMPFAKSETPTRFPEEPQIKNTKWS
ncbi:MAG: hypothetical protein HY752_00645 [Nitrospirae bacterium]|nr:hypothetical protein [Nitrospirota bacterium]